MKERERERTVVLVESSLHRAVTLDFVIRSSARLSEVRVGRFLSMARKAMTPKVNINV